MLEFLKKAEPAVKKTCKKCGTESEFSIEDKSLFICPNCGAYLRMGPKARIAARCGLVFREGFGIKE